ncbi:hypothetical protein V8F33_000820 [Rhypophila sp. PSN 637]
MRQDPGPEILSGEVSPAGKIHCQVMEIYPDDSERDVPLASSFFMSTPEEAVLVPEESAEYTCRWIDTLDRHLTDRSPTMARFTTIVNGMMRNYSDSERKLVIDGLHGVRRQNETKGFYGPKLRPGYVPLKCKDQQGNVYNCIELLAESNPELETPAFVSFPTLHFWPPPPSVTDSHPPTSSANMLHRHEDVYAIDPSGHRPKSLLQYHYKFGKDVGDHSVKGSSITFAAQSNIPVVMDSWCLVIDKKNIITVSGAAGILIWPLGIRHKNNWVRLPYSFRMSCQDYFGRHLELLEGLRVLEGWTSYKFMIWRVYTWLAGTCSVLASFIPGGWIPGYFLNSLLYCGLGVQFDFPNSVRLWTLACLLDPSDLGQKRDHAFQQSASIILGALGCQVRQTKQLELTKASTHYVDGWLKVDELIRGHVDPSDELFKAIRQMWAIYVHFHMNFHVDREGMIYNLHYQGALQKLAWTARVWLVRFFGQVESQVDENVTPKDIPVTFQPRKRGETLQDLEDDFIDAMAQLNIQLELTNDGIHDIEQHQNKDMLRNIHTSAAHPAMACLFRMCTLATPSRFLISSRDISDMYARATAQLEWLTRRSVTQSIIYQISDIEDELSIIKKVMLDQKTVISQVATALAKFLSLPVSRLGKPGAPLAHNLLDEAMISPSHSTPSTQSNFAPGKIHNPARPENIIVERLQQSSLKKHDILMAEIEQHEETVKRLKSKAALLINIKNEGQGMAVFVFTIVTVIFLPLSFVATYLGMNTNDIRDMDQGQWTFWVIGGPLAVVVVLGGWLVASRGPGWSNSRQARRLRNAEDWKWVEK